MQPIVSAIDTKTAAANKAQKADLPTLPTFLGSTVVCGRVWWMVGT